MYIYIYVHIYMYKQILILPVFPQGSLPFFYDPLLLKPPSLEDPIEVKGSGMYRTFEPKP